MGRRWCAAGSGHILLLTSVCFTPACATQTRLKAAEARLAATTAEKDATIADLQDQVGRRCGDLCATRAACSWCAADAASDVVASALRWHAGLAGLACRRGVASQPASQLSSWLHRKPTLHLAQCGMSCTLSSCPLPPKCFAAVFVPWQVRDLMIFLEARQTIEAAGGGSELEGASVLPIPEQQQQQQAGGAGSGRGGGRRGKRR